jgi:hypothetical protein
LAFQAGKIEVPLFAQGLLCKGRRFIFTRYGQRMSYEIIKSDILEDKQLILDFWNRNNPNRLDEKFDWMYLSNPDGLASTWLVKHSESSGIVGMASVFPRTFRYKDKTYKGGIQGDFFISSKHRSFGPALMLIRAIIKSFEESDYDFLLTLPNKKAEPIFKRAGYNYLGVIKKCTRLFDAKRLLIEKAPIPHFLSNLIGPIANQLVKLIYPDTWFFNLGRFDTKIAATLDFNIQYISRLYHQNYFATDKNTDYLKWKYEKDPDDDHKFFYIMDASRQVVGCIVFCIEDGDYVQIREILYPQDPSILAALMCLFFNETKRRNYKYAYAQIYENSGILTSSNNLDLTISGHGRNVFYIINSAKPTVSQLNTYLHSACFNLFTSDEDT